MGGVRNANFTTQFQEFLKESYEKESSKRLAWFAKRRTQTVTKSRQLEVFRKKITEGSQPSEALLSRLPAITKEASHHRKYADYNDPHMESRPAQVGVVARPWMRPATPTTWESLFDGFTKDEKGRYQYLKKRYKVNPEDKYTFPILSSWDYGWRLGDIIKKEDLKKPTHGRTRVVHDTFFTRNGIVF